MLVTLCGHRWLILAAMVALALAAGARPAGAAATLYVDDDCSCPTPTGTSACPYCHIQNAINAAVAGDTVVVRPGTYVENIDFLGKAITVTSTDPLDPSVVASTVIDGGCAGSVVTFATSELPGSTIQGFTITNGCAMTGGGIYCYASSPTIANNVIVANSAEYGNGGGIACAFASAAILVNNQISGNIADLGAGVYCGSYAWPAIEGCLIADNAALFGGGVYCHMASPEITHSTISGNTAQYGAGIYCIATAEPLVSNTVIADNPADFFGGGVRLYDNCTMTVVNSTIAGNTSPAGAGSIPAPAH
jgi:hypothetical protein